MRTIAALVWVIVLSAAVSSCDQRGSRPSSSSSSGSHTTYGEIALVLASRIPGCRRPHSSPVPSVSARGLVSIAECDLGSDIIVIYTWADAASEEAANVTLAGPSAWWSSGPGWSQILGDDDSAAAQLSAARVVAQALHGSVLG